MFRCSYWQCFQSKFRSPACKAYMPVLWEPALSAPLPSMYDIARTKRSATTKVVFNFSHTFRTSTDRLSFVLSLWLLSSGKFDLAARRSERCTHHTRINFGGSFLNWDHLLQQESFSRQGLILTLSVSLFTFNWTDSIKWEFQISIVKGF